MKKTLSIRLDQDTLDELVKMNLNISATLREMLKHLVDNSICPLCNQKIKKGPK